MLSLKEQIDFWLREELLPNNLKDELALYKDNILELKNKNLYLFWTYFDLYRTLELSWSLFANNFTTWQSTNIFDTNLYKLSFLHESHRPSGWYLAKIKYSPDLVGSSLSHIKIGNPNIVLGVHELLQYLYVDKSFLKKLDGTNNYPFFYLGDVLLKNKKTKHDLTRTLCFYKVGQYMVLDRASVDYNIPWNSVMEIRNLRSVSSLDNH